MESRSCFFMFFRGSTGRPGFYYKIYVICLFNIALGDPPFLKGNSSRKTVSMFQPAISDYQVPLDPKKMKKSKSWGLKLWGYKVIL